MNSVKKIVKAIYKVLVFPAVFLGVLLSTGIFWMLDTWQNLNIDEMLYYLQAPKEGVDPNIIIGFLIKCLLPSVVVLMITVFITKVWKKKRNIYGYIVLFSTLCSSVFAVSHVWEKLDIGNYLKNGTLYSAFIDDYYVYPSEVSITFPREKRNLIYIFSESMESTFADVSAGGAFDENLIPNLTGIALENECFNGDSTMLNGAEVLNKTTYTMGALFAQSTGLPLILPFGGNAMSAQESFLPQLEGVGDILEKEGYKNIFLIGSEAAFGGRDIFYRDHGNYEIYDYNTAKSNGEIPDDYFVFWGYEDRRMFEIAKKSLLELSKSDQPFNLTMLTVDTHFEDGYLCEQCENLHGNNVYADVYNCADRQISDFIRWVQEQDFYENTTIVLAGDHLTMDSDFCKDLDNSYTRKVLTTIINAAVETKSNAQRRYSTLDLFPTTLAALGANIEGNRLGLGTNVYSSEQTLLEQYGAEYINLEFDKKSVMIEHLNQSVDLGKSVEMYKDQWFFPAYQFAVEKGILLDNDSEFKPEEEVRRAAIVQAFYRLEGEPETKENPAGQLFTDVKGTEYEEALDWAYENGIIFDQDQSGIFRGDEAVKREELVAMLYGYAAYKGLDLTMTSTLEGMENVELLSDWAEDEMRWAVGAQIISGINENDLAPQNGVTYAQAITIFMRLYDIYGLHETLE